MINDPLIIFKKCSGVVFSFLAAWMLTVMPLPLSIQWAKPEYILLTLLYWVILKPQRGVGAFTAWFLGLLMDVAKGTLLGQHALTFVIITMIARIWQYRYKSFPGWRQWLIIFYLIGISKVIFLAVQWLIGHPPQSILYWGSTITSVLLWGGLYHLLGGSKERVFN